MTGLKSGYVYNVAKSQLCHIDTWITIAAYKLQFKGWYKWQDV